MTHFVGVDIAKHSFDIATLQANGKYRTKGKLPNQASGFAEFDGWLQAHAQPGSLIVMEATGTYYEALAEQISADQLVQRVLKKIPVPDKPMAHPKDGVHG